jgi:hypothetical protein
MARACVGGEDIYLKTSRIETREDGVLAAAQLLARLFAARGVEGAVAAEFRRGGFEGLSAEEAVRKLRRLTRASTGELRRLVGPDADLLAMFGGAGVHTRIKGG